MQFARAPRARAHGVLHTRAIGGAQPQLSHGTSSRNSFIFEMVLFGYSDTQKTGVALAALGGLFLFLGVLLLFDGGLLACVAGRAGPPSLMAARCIALASSACVARFLLSPPSRAHTHTANSIGNLLLFTGITLILGVKRTLQFFNPFMPGRKSNMIRGVVCIAIGLSMLLLRRGWSSIAFIIECALGGWVPVPRRTPSFSHRRTSRHDPQKKTQ
jgi:hypothetical protein